MLNILILCTGNSCRSVLGEAIINHQSQGRVKAFSAGSHPTGKINANALATLARNGLPTDGYRSQSWDEFVESVLILRLRCAIKPLVKFVLSISIVQSKHIGDCQTLHISVVKRR